MSTSEEKAAHEPETIQRFFDYVAQEHGDIILGLCKSEIEKAPTKNLASILNEALKVDSQSQKTTPSIGGQRFNSD